jgi:GMP synthase-like glutamine amidotransferase
LNDEGKQILKTDKDFIRIYQFHQDHVSVVPKGFKNLAFTEGNTPNHITVSENGQCITIQGHPEFEKETITTMITVRKITGILEKDFANRCLETLASEPLEMEDVWFTERVLDFILGQL